MTPRGRGRADRRDRRARRAAGADQLGARAPDRHVAGGVSLVRDRHRRAGGRRRARDAAAWARSARSAASSWIYLTGGMLGAVYITSVLAHGPPARRRRRRRGDDRRPARGRPSSSTSSGCSASERSAGHRWRRSRASRCSPRARTSSSGSRRCAPRPRSPRGCCARARDRSSRSIRGHGGLGTERGRLRAVLRGSCCTAATSTARSSRSQPPWTYLFGAGALAIHDSLDWLRFACGLLQVGTGLLAAEAVWRLTAHRLAAIAAAGLVVVTPWATHQHGLLLPEQLGSPLLLGAALLAARPATARWAGVLVAVAVFAKLPFALPAALIVLAVAGARVALRWAAGALARAGRRVHGDLRDGISGRDIVTAQSQAGQPARVPDRLVGAGGLEPLRRSLVFAAVALWQRGQAAEPRCCGRSPRRRRARSR